MKRRDIDKEVDRLRERYIDIERKRERGRQRERGRERKKERKRERSNRIKHILKSKDMRKSTRIHK